MCKQSESSGQRIGNGGLYVGPMRLETDTA